MEALGINLGYLLTLIFMSSATEHHGADEEHH